MKERHVCPISRVSEKVKQENTRKHKKNVRKHKKAQDNTRQHRKTQESTHRRTDGRTFDGGKALYQSKGVLVAEGSNLHGEGKPGAEAL